MQFKFASGINTVLFIIPVLVILAIYAGIGVWVYFSGAAVLLEDFHSAQLVTMLSDKKNGVEMWFDMRRKALEEIAGSPVVVDEIRRFSEKASVKKGPEGTETSLNKDCDSIPEDGVQRISKYLAGFGQFRAVYFISGDGRLLWSTNGDGSGKEQADGKVFGNIPAGKTSVVSGKIGSTSNCNEIFIAAPVRADGKDMHVMVVGLPNAADLASSLVVEKGFYQTGKAAVIDNEGMTLASRDMTGAGKIKYDVPPGGDRGVEYRDGLFYTVTSLKFDGLRLIATLDAAEAAKPLTSFLPLYLSFAGIILLVVVVQGLVAVPRLINRPINRFVMAMQSVSKGDFRAINLKKGFFGEMKTLAGAFSDMIIGLNRLKTSGGKGALPGISDRSGSLIAEALSVEVGTRLEGIRKRLESFSAACPDKGAEIISAAVDIRSLMETTEALNLLVGLRSGSVTPLAGNCDLRAMLREAEDECRILLGGSEIELIVDCHENLEGAVIRTDPGILKALVSSLLRHAVRVTELGTITLLASCESKEGVKCLELVLTDTGRGVDRQSMDRVFRDGAFPSLYPNLGVAGEFAELLGGRIAMDSLQGKGSLVAVYIPMDDGAVKAPMG